MTPPDDKLDSKVLPLPLPRLEVEVEKPSPSQAEELRERADGRRKSDDHIGAIEDYTAALALDPENRAAYFGRALAAYDLGDHPAAIRDFTKALALRPSAMGYFNRGLSRRRDGDEEGAREDFKKAPDIVLETAREYCETRTQDYALAVYYLDIAIEAVPRSFEAFRLRGIVMQDTNRYGEAVRDYTAALHIQSSPSVLFNRGVVRHLLNDLPGALADLNEAIALRSTDKNYFWQRGLIKEALGDPSGAFADFTRSLGGPSEKTKKKIREDIRGDRRWSRVLLTVGGTAWLCMLFFLPKHPEYSILGIVLVGSLSTMSLKYELSALGVKEPDHQTEDFISFFLGLLGPVALIVFIYFLGRRGALCRTCSTDAAPGAASCRRCGTPLVADG